MKNYELQTIMTKIFKMETSNILVEDKIDSISVSSTLGKNIK